MSYLKRKRLILFLLVNETSYIKYRRSSHSDNRIPPSRRTRPLDFTYEGARIDGILRKSKIGFPRSRAAGMIMASGGSLAVMMFLEIKTTLRYY